MGKCLWCNHKADGLPYVAIGETNVPYCNDGCLAKSLKYFRFWERSKSLVIFWIVVSSLVMLGTIPAAFVSELATVIILCVGWAMASLTLCFFPFATPQTIQLAGIRNSIVITRLVGVLMVLATALWPLSIL